MLSALSATSPLAVGLMVLCLILVLAFEFSNGFHDTANAVATVIYTNSLKPLAAVVWPGLMNFLGVLLGGIAVAYALVAIIPPDVLSPPNGGPAIGLLAALFVSALAWNLLTWASGIPNSSSHALIGALVGIAVENSLVRGRGLDNGIDWHQIWNVLLSLLVSPLLGFACSWLLFLAAVPGDRTAAARQGPFRPARRDEAAGRLDARPADPDLHRRQLRAWHERRAEEHRPDHADDHRPRPATFALNQTSHPTTSGACRRRRRR